MADFRFGLRQLPQKAMQSVGLRSKFKLTPKPITLAAAVLTWSVLSNEHLPMGPDGYYSWGGSVAVSNGKAYFFGGIYEGSETEVTNQYGRLECRSVEDGRLLWGFDIDPGLYPEESPLPVEIAVDDEALYLTYAYHISGGMEQFIRVEKRALDGALIWVQERNDYDTLWPIFSGMVLTADAMILQHFIYDAGASKELFEKRSKADGSVVWSQVTEPGENESIEPTGIAATGNYVYATSHLQRSEGTLFRSDGIVRRIDPDDGSSMWAKTRASSILQSYVNPVCLPACLMLPGDQADSDWVNQESFCERRDYDSGEIIETVTGDARWIQGASASISDGFWCSVYAFDGTPMLTKYDLFGAILKDMPLSIDFGPWYSRIIVSDKSLFMVGDSKSQDGLYAWISERRTLEGLL